MKRKDLEEKVKDLEGKWKRAVADYQNLEKRVARERETLVKFANFSFIKKTIPLKDSLEKATQSSPGEGVGLVLKQLEGILRDEGVEEIEAQGAKFNPHFHECVEAVEGGQEGMVVEVVAKGYKIGERIIRPARVKVGKKKTNNNYA